MFGCNGVFEVSMNMCVRWWLVFIYVCCLIKFLLKFLLCFYLKNNMLFVLMCLILFCIFVKFYKDCGVLLSGVLDLICFFDIWVIYGLNYDYYFKR